MNKKPFWVLLSLILILSFVLVACAPAAETEAPAPEAEVPTEEPVEEAEVPTEEPAEEAEAPTEEPAEEAEAPTEEPAEEVSERAKTLIFDIDGGRVTDPELWNTFTPGARLDQGYHQTILEPLFVLNYQTGEIEPWLGTEMTSNDAFDVWTLKLREGVKWSDGEDFNADDVVFTINMMLENIELQRAAAMADWVDSVEKVDDLTVQFNLNRPNPFFQLNNFSVRIWGGPNIVPEHIWKDVDPLTFKFYDPEQGWPVGTGPYTLDSVSPTEFVYVRDDNWWGAESGWKELPAPEIIVWTWAGPEETRAALMADAQLDSLMDITLGALQALQEKNPNVITWFDEMPMAWVPDPCSRTFYFNHTVEPWDDPDMRWAINYAMNREQIVEISYEGTTLPSRHFFPAYPPLDALVDKAIAAGAWDLDQLWTHDPDLAKEIIESKGYVMNESTGYYEKDGEELSMDMSTHEAFIEKQRIAQVLVEQFQAVGINAVQRNEAGGTWGDNRAFGTFETQMNWEMCGSVNEPWASSDQIAYKWFKPVGERADRNEARWSGEKAEAYDALVEEMGTLPLGDPRVEELFIEASKLFFEELPIIPVTQAKKIIPFDTTYWTGWPTFENDYIHPPTWWQHTHVIIHNLEPTGAQ
jgi:peptide/nickel transport system substrate-binding protein